MQLGQGREARIIQNIEWVSLELGRRGTGGKPKRFPIF